LCGERQKGSPSRSKVIKILPDVRNALRLIMETQ
jgi:hypothetical protein